MNAPTQAVVDAMKRDLLAEMRRMAALGSPLTQIAVDEMLLTATLRCQQIAADTASSPGGRRPPECRMASVFEKWLQAGDISSAVRKKII